MAQKIAELEQSEKKETVKDVVSVSKEIEPVMKENECLKKEIELEKKEKETLIHVNNQLNDQLKEDDKIMLQHEDYIAILQKYLYLYKEKLFSAGL